MFLKLDNELRQCLKIFTKKHANRAKSNVKCNKNRGVSTVGVHLPLHLKVTGSSAANETLENSIKCLITLAIKTFSLMFHTNNLT